MSTASSSSSDRGDVMDVGSDAGSDVSSDVSIPHRHVMIVIILEMGSIGQENEV